MAHDAASASSDDDPWCGALIATHPISMVVSHGDDASHVGNGGKRMHLHLDLHFPHVGLCEEVS